MANDRSHGGVPSLALDSIRATRGGGHQGAIGGSAPSSDTGFSKDSAPQRPIAPVLTEVTLTSILGAVGLTAAVFPGASKKSSEGSQTATSEVFEKVLGKITALQSQLLENEAAIAEMQAKSDTMDKKNRSWKRQAERAEDDAADAETRRESMQAAANAARMEAAPLVERYMEAEVLRSQLETDEEEAKRLHLEAEVCEEELSRGLPRLCESESLAAELSEAITEMETTHTGECAMLRSAHLEDVADLRTQHASRVADVETARLAEISNAKISICEDLSNQRAEMQQAQWEADVYAREQEDAIREVCIRQRENGRLAKRYGEARKEAFELAVRWEAEQDAPGSPIPRTGNGAELRLVHQRCSLLERTVSEWQESLHRKSADCARWKQRAARRGIAVGPSEADDTLIDLESVARPASPRSVSSNAGPGATARTSLQVPFLELSSISASAPGTPGRSAPHTGLWSGVPTPTRTPNRTSRQSFQSSPKSGQAHATKRRLSRNNSAPSGQLLQSRKTSTELLSRRESRSSPFPFDGFESWVDHSGLLIPEVATEPQIIEIPSLVSPEQALHDGDSAHELLAAALHAAKVWADAEEASMVLSDPEAEFLSTAAGNTLQLALHSPSKDLRKDLVTAVKEAENELEVLTFLLDESASLEAEALLEQQARHQPAAIGRRLRQQINTLALHRQSR